MIGILGGGLAGLTVAAHCKQECEVLEASDRVGGHCKSIQENGFTFDEGPHIIFSKNKKTLDYMLSLLGDNVVQGRRNNKIYYKGRYIKYPFENGIGELEPQERYECVRDFVHRDLKGSWWNFRGFLRANYGYAITDKYLQPYNEKIWKCPAEDMAYDWAEERLPKIYEEEIIKSACGVPTEGYTHQLNFYYPKTGGIGSLVKAMAKKVRLITSNFPICNVRRYIANYNTYWGVSDDGKQWRSREYEYDKIVSTLPLVEMVDIFTGVPQEIKDAAKQLRFNSLITVTLGYKYWLPLNATAVYVPDPDIIFHRLSFPYQFSYENKETIQAEITTNVDDTMWNTSDGELVKRVVSGIQEIGIMPTDIPIYAKVQRLKYGYPVPTFSYRANLKKIRDYFEGQGILLCGRNAEFEYINMDQCIEHGMEVAAKL